MTRPDLRVVVQLEENLREAELLCGKHSETLRIYAPKGKKVDLDSLQNKLRQGLGFISWAGTNREVQWRAVY